MKNFELTINAANKIKKLLDKEIPNSFFRISILGGGCSGFQYDFSYDIKASNDDLVQDNILIDKQSAELLKGSEIDYAEELIRKAIDIDPGNPAILDSLAWVLYLDGSYKDAYEYASLAYIKDQDPEIVSHYYKILLKNGFIQKAKKILEQSLLNNPENDQLLQLLDEKSDEAAQL